MYGVQLRWQLSFTRADAQPATTKNVVNYKNASYAGKGILFFFCVSVSLRFTSITNPELDYFIDACYQALVYWIMSSATNDPFRLARFAGIYKAVQSAVCPLSLYLMKVYTDGGTGSCRQLWNGRDAYAVSQRARESFSTLVHRQHVQ